jgi:prophage DNA circulation protein
MATARDWLKTLWAASFKGVPFFVEKDDEAGGRRIVVHQFPMRDDPYLEDLGEDQRDFEVTAYVASDSADTDAGALVVTCATRGAGVLVLPTHGPILVRCLTFSRERSKDKHGYIAFSLKFIREGAAGALVSVAMLSNLIFVAADASAAAIATSFAASLQVAPPPVSPGVVGPSTVASFVVQAASDAAQTALSALDVLRTSEPVDPIASAVQRDAIQLAFTQAPELIASPATVSSVATSIISIARALGDAISPASAVPAFDALANDPTFAYVAPAAPYTTPSAAAAVSNHNVVMRTLRLAALTSYAEAIARVPLPDRPTAITLRANVAEYFEAEMDYLPATQIDLYHAIAAIRDSVIKYLSTSIINLAPVLTVSANLSLPSLYWAWRLYQDPTRSTDLVARNKVVHPSLMPLNFEALAPAK